MPSTYTSNNKIQKIATGEQSGTWGSTTNTNFDLFDTAIDGSVTVALSGTTQTLNIPDGAAGDGRNKVLIFTGSLAGTNTVTITPSTVKKHYFVQNNTTGGQNIVISQGSGSSVTVKPGYSSIVYLDGAGSGAAVKEVLTSLKLTALLEATGAVLVGSSSGSTTLQASATASGTLTLPAATDTLVGKATTDTFTNKTLDTAGTGNVLKINGTQVSAVTGSGSVVLATSPTLVTPLLGTPTSGTLTNCTGLPISTGVSGLSANMSTFLATASSANLAATVTDETGSGSLVFANTPVLVSPVLGTPTSGTLTNCTGLPVSSGISGLGTGVATFLATPSSANLASAVTDETGTGALVFGSSPTIATPTITTSAVIPLINGGTAASSTLTLQSTSGAGTTDAIIFKTASQSEKMRILSTGEVGIGTASPGKKLEIYENNTSVVATELLRLNNPSANGTNNGMSIGFFQDTIQQGRIRSFYTVANGWTFNIGCAANDHLTINNSGNVGIGTASPNYKLDVNGTFNVATGTYCSLGGLRAFANSGNFQYYYTGPDSIAWRNSSDTSELMRLTNAGNVGIGTPNPTRQLDVYGTGQNTSNLTDAGSLSASIFAGSSNGTTGAGGAIVLGGIVANGVFAQTAIKSLMVSTSGNGTGSLAFSTRGATSDTALTERMRILSTGEVGIGTTSPQTLLTVGSYLAGTGEATNRGYIQIQDPFSSSTIDGSRGLEFKSSPSGSGYGYKIGTVSDVNLAIGYRANSATFVERMRIDSSGNVGIGTASPSVKLSVAGSTIIGAENLALVGAAVLDLYAANGGYTSPIIRMRQVGASNYGVDMGIDNATNGGLIFSRVNAGTALPMMTLARDTGNVGIGTSSPIYQLQLSTDSAAKPSTDKWTIASDARLKNVKGEYTKGLAEICQIRPVRYEYNGKGGFVADGKENISILAQELMAVFPECVGTFKGKLSESDTEETDLYNYNGHAITFALINAIKELKAKVDLLESRN